MLITFPTPPHHRVITRHNVSSPALSDLQSKERWGVEVLGVGERREISVGEMETCKGIRLCLSIMVLRFPSTSWYY